MHAAAKTTKASAAATGLLDKAPDAVAKLKAKGGEVKCLTVAEIFAVALRYFGTALKKGLKPDVVLQLRKLIVDQPGVIEFSTVPVPVAATATASPAAAATDPATATLAALEAAADSEDEEEGGDGWGGDEEEEEEEEGELSDEEGEESEEETEAELGGRTRTKRPRG